MSFFQDTDRATFESLLSEEQQLKRIYGWDSNSARTSIKWQRLCEKMFNLCCRKDPVETMFTFYNATPSDSDQILLYQQMIQLMKNMLFSYYPDITPKSLWGPQATPVPVQRDTQGFGTTVPAQTVTQGFGTPVPAQSFTTWSGNAGFDWAPPEDPAQIAQFILSDVNPTKNPEPEEKEEENPKN